MDGVILAMVWRSAITRHRVVQVMIGPCFHDPHISTTLNSPEPDPMNLDQREHHRTAKGVDRQERYDITRKNVVFK